MEVKLLNPSFLEGEQLRTGSDQFLLKSNRMYVGIYDEKLGWFVPLVGKLPKKAMEIGVYPTPFSNNNTHLENPGLNFQKAVYIENDNALLPIRQTMPKLQKNFIENHLDDIGKRFAIYVRSVVQLPLYDKALKVSSVPFYPKGIEKILGQKVDRFGLEGPVTRYVSQENSENETKLQSSPHTVKPEEAKEDVYMDPEKENQDTPHKTIKELLAEKNNKGLEEHLKKGMAAYLDSDTYKKFLAFSALLPQYSSKNRHLIFNQNKDARFVAGFNKWKELGNPIKKGGKALKIMAPYKYFLKDSDGQKVLDKNDQPIEKVGYRFVSVFDQSQTEHPEKIPSQLKEIKGDFSQEAKPFLNIMNALQTATTAKIILNPMENKSEHTKGYFVSKKNQIVIREGLGQKATVAVALHEVAHSRLHREVSGKFGDTEYAKNEFEAESVAYIVGTTLGVDMSEQSFGYMKSWQPNEKNLQSLSESFETIKQEAEKMIDEIDTKLTLLQNPEKEVNQSPLAEIEEARGKKIGNTPALSSNNQEQKEELNAPLKRR